MDIKLEFVDYSFIRVQCEQSTFYELKDHFSFFAEGYRFNPKFRYGMWSGKIYLLDNQGLIAFGLLGELYKFASNMGCRPTYSRKRRFI